MRKALHILLFCLLVVSAFAQQDPMFNKYMFNPLVINPAYAGSRDVVSTVLLHRSQWVGFNNNGESGSSTQTFSIHGALLQKKLGLGLSIVRDKIGPSTSTGIMGAYAYRVRIGKGKLALGLRTAIYSYQYDWTKIEYRDKTDVYANQQLTNYWVPSFDFGVRYDMNNLYAGIALSHLNQPSIGIDPSATQIDSVQYGSSLTAHVAGNFGYAVKINDNLVFRPSILYKAVKGQTQSTDLNLSFLMNKNIWLGVTVRSNYGLVAMAEYNINSNMRVGYSYDISMNRLRNSNSGSHEIFIGFDFNPMKSKVMSARYF